MIVMALLDRVKTRLSDEEVIPKDNELEEYITTATDRINLRIGTAELPDSMQSIAVDVAVKLIRRKYYEGIASEGADTLSTSFVANVLAEYESEFEQYLKNVNKRVVKFL